MLWFTHRCADALVSFVIVEGNRDTFTAPSTETSISTITASRHALLIIRTPWFSIHPTSVTTAAGPAATTANGKIC